LFIFYVLYLNLIFVSLYYLLYYYIYINDMMKDKITGRLHYLFKESGHLINILSNIPFYSIKQLSILF